MQLSTEAERLEYSRRTRTPTIDVAPTSPFAEHEKLCTRIRIESVKLDGSVL